MTDSLATSPDEQTAQPDWLVSVSFWLLLFVAAIIYATVALSPKIERFLLLEQEHTTNQWQLVALEKQVRQLDRVANALEHDPQFASELARSRFGTAGGDQSAISVADELQINYPSATEAVTVELPWYYGIVRRFASNETLRKGSLIAASLLVLFGFGFLHARYAQLVRRFFSRLSRSARSLGSRYHVAADE